MFSKKTTITQTLTDRLPEFSYIGDDNIYMDSACQSMRPQPVIDALNDYYTTYNACGERVKYKWGQKVDAGTEAARELAINYLELSSKNYVCSFTLNTSYGLNLIFNQLPSGVYDQVITSEIEHNSVFLPTIELAKRLGITRKVLKRDLDGNLIYSKNDTIKSIVVVNATSNIDGRLLSNIKQLIKDVHKDGGIVIIDAAQTMAHYHETLIGCEADAFCFSAHKMYASSLGGIIIRKDLMRSLNKKIVGGGMVAAVKENSYTLLPEAEMYSWLEPGLQAWGEIISLKQSFEWLKTVRPQGLKPAEYIAKISEQLYQGLVDIPGLVVLNNRSSSVISVYSPKIDAHRLAVFLSGAGIMVRSGYFCCHYYLIEKLKMPPLLRFSIGLNTTETDITRTLKTLKKFTEGIR
jgi:cysteine desulfurase/selenocysteine lyase